MEEKIPIYMYWLISIGIVLLNWVWMRNWRKDVFMKAAVSAAIASVLVIVINGIVQGELSNLFPIAFIFYGVPLFLFNCICVGIMKVINKKPSANV